MRVVAFVKQVPAAAELPWDPKTGQLRRWLAPGMMNPACRSALEAALRLKEATGCDLTAVSMGPASAEEVLREALALGADRAFLLNDPLLAGADTPATSYTLACAVKAVCPEFALLFLGTMTTDSETGQVGPHLAEELNLPAVFGVESLELKGRELLVIRERDGYEEELSLPLPALVTIAPRGFPPRHVPLTGVEPAFAQGELVRLSAEDLRVDPERVGMKGSAARIRRVYPQQRRGRAELIQGGPKKAAAELLGRFGERMSGLGGRGLAPQGPRPGEEQS